MDLEFLAMRLMPLAPLAAFAPIVVLMYFYLVWDAKKTENGDTQIGLKVTLHTFILLGVLMVSSSLVSILWFILAKMSKPSPGSELIKGGLSGLLGGAASFGAGFVLLQRTNFKEFPKATRLTVGVIAVFAGLAALSYLTAFFNGLIMSGPWFMNSISMASLLVYGAMAFFAISKHGELSGWTAPPPRPAGFPPQQGGGFPPQQGGGYPPQQGGGYPPQGGGYPPQGGGYPPQGGGYPPQGGGGLPPPSGGYPPGGYPPR